jgi:hypothetical protein
MPDTKELFFDRRLMFWGGRGGVLQKRDLSKYYLRVEPRGITMML